MVKTPYIIALYIRLSTEDIKINSLSIENQKYALHQYVESVADFDGAEIQEFVDNGFSGTTFERPAMQKLLDQVQKGAVNCIIVKDFSRFGRNSMEVEYYLERVLPLYNVRFIALNDGYDSAQLQGDTGGINVAFKYLLNELYSKDLSIKYKSAKFAKFRRGEYQSKICPYGYKKAQAAGWSRTRKLPKLYSLFSRWLNRGWEQSRSLRPCMTGTSRRLRSTKRPTGLMATIFPDVMEYGMSPLWPES